MLFALEKKRARGKERVSSLAYLSEPALLKKVVVVDDKVFGGVGCEYFQGTETPHEQKDPMDKSF